MNIIYTPTKSVCDWKDLLASPEKQWKIGYSARSMAYSWENAGGFPKTVKSALLQCFQSIEPLFIFPEHKVALPGGKAASQNDAWVLAKNEGELISIAVEGKVSESFDMSLSKWKSESSEGKKIRYDFLKTSLNLEDIPDTIKYQLLHRTTSAILEAERFNANHAVLLIHSFSQQGQWFEDFSSFVQLFGFNSDEIILGKINSMVMNNGLNLHFVWVRGDELFLTK